MHGCVKAPCLVDSEGLQKMGKVLGDRKSYAYLFKGNQIDFNVYILVKMTSIHKKLLQKIKLVDFFKSLVGRWGGAVLTSCHGLFIKNELSGNFLCKVIKARLYHLPLPTLIPQPKSVSEGK